MNISGLNVRSFYQMCCFQGLPSEEIKFQYISVLFFQGINVMKLDSNGCCILLFFCSFPSGLSICKFEGTYSYGL